MRIDTIYIEEAIAQHSRTLSIISRFPNARKICCERYNEVFNPKNQSFRLQKQNPALILAQKQKGFVLPAPDGYGIGGDNNFYFSHMLNCLYDCRYCFIQGMYRSANYVLFINYEDFSNEIKRVNQSLKGQENWFYSGYDCDSLAMDQTTEFSQHILPAFKGLDDAWLELRTKSTQIRTLLDQDVLENVVVAFSLNPEKIAIETEHMAPPLQKRLKAMKKLADQGWKIGLRFDPLIYDTNCIEQYSQLFKQVFSIIKSEQIHSVSLGPFRLPKNNYQTLLKLYPEERLFHAPLELNNGMMAYRQPLEKELIESCTHQLLEYINPHQFFPCTYD